MTQWKTCMCQTYFGLFCSLQVLASLSPIALVASNFIFYFLISTHSHDNHPNLSWCFPSFTRHACQDDSVPPSALPALNPSNCIRKGPK